MDIRTRATTIHVRERGSGEPALVFLHYWGGSSRTWDAVVGELSSAHRSIAVDHRGWGNSAAPEQGYTIADLANDAHDVIEALKLSRYVLVGHPKDCRASCSSRRRRLRRWCFPTSSAPRWRRRTTRVNRSNGCWITC